LHLLVQRATSLIAKQRVDGSSQTDLLLSRFVAENTHLSCAAALHLIRIGAVYHRRHQATGSTPTTSTVDPLHLPQHPPPERQRRDIPLIAGDYVRVCVRPRYYPAAGHCWPSLVVCETPEFLVVHKPRDLPSHATMDNGRENLLDCLREHIMRREGRVCAGKGDITLLLPQRLDVATCGLMFVARSHDMVRTFAKWSRAGQLSKRYKALVTFQVHARDSNELDRILTAESLHHRLCGLFAPGDRIVSVLRKTTVSPKEYQWQTPAVDANVPWQDCVSRVQSLRPVVVKTRADWRQQQLLLLKANNTQSVQSTVTTDLSNALEAWMACGEPQEYIAAQEVVIELITGRTHQIRGQLQSLQRHSQLVEKQQLLSGFHVAGDRMYAGVTTPTPTCTVSQPTVVRHHLHGYHEPRSYLALQVSRSILLCLLFRGCHCSVSVMNGSPVLCRSRIMAVKVYCKICTLKAMKRGGAHC
jgi:23S rRNA-/tRNA-specific pseudouridylate synthase